MSAATPAAVVGQSSILAPGASFQCVDIPGMILYPGASPYWFLASLFTTAYMAFPLGVQLILASSSVAMNDFLAFIVLRGFPSFQTYLWEVSLAC